MNTLELKPGDKVGIFYYDSVRIGTKAEIEVIERISPTGQVTLSNGKRYTSDGKEIGVVEPSYLWTLDKIQPILEKIETLERQKEAERSAYLASPEGRRKQAVNDTVKAAIAALNQYGWYADVDGHMDAMESEIEQIIKKYVSEHEPIS
ncbi:hypothetical protein [Nostoc sp. C110]|uniref:hypothetical protein n=1 Tax=Nostoc sp. C110 TaxID=3349876 RepID=UPI00370D8D91